MECSSGEVADELVPLEGAELTLRDALLAMGATSGQDPWGADSAEIFTPAVRKTGVSWTVLRSRSRYFLVGAGVKM